MRGSRRTRRAPERRKLTRLKGLWSRARGPLAVVGLCALLACPLWVWGVGWWLDFSDAPVHSDYLVVLAGDFARPHAAAELFKTGIAPSLWLSRPFKSWGYLETLRIGVPVPSEEEIDRKILLKLGIPDNSIRLYGDGVLSTYEEAKAFQKEAQPQGKKVLVLTSRVHARRAKIIFKSVLTGCDLRVVGAADPTFTRRWWSNQTMSYAAILETVKTVYWFAGGRFKR